MEILSFDVSAGRPAEPYGSVGVTAQALFRGEAVAVTVLYVAAGGEVGRHPAPVDQLMVITAGHGVVQAGGGDWENVNAGRRWCGSQVRSTPPGRMPTSLLW
ncbi:hypothetical protein ACIBF5_04000 [Micromonospora sp. NPDC050417]|uniref:hypothetical protein n=1 Tax=Micromonospora sp. NPDC050417 TaxID=3364280 RepID=UPI0037880883